MYNKICRLLPTSVDDNQDLVTIKIFRNKEHNLVSNTNKIVKKKPNKANSIDYRGMTLKEYFRLSEIGPSPEVTEIK